MSMRIGLIGGRERSSDYKGLTVSKKENGEERKYEENSYKHEPTSLNLSFATTTLLWENIVFPFLVATMSILCWQISVSQKSWPWWGSCWIVKLNFSHLSPCQGSWCWRPCNWSPSHLYPSPVSSHSSSNLPPTWRVRLVSKDQRTMRVHCQKVVSNLWDAQAAFHS